ncbi:MAG TPA: hypothetical protein VMM13_11820 [Euzebya sp.]|nr:hypothetical protein [Euzebya sp.]
MTITSVPPAAWAVLESALRARRPVHVAYHGRRRLICPHALGWNHGRPMVLGYQTGGQTSSGALPANPHKRWRCLFIDEVDQVLLADPSSPWRTADNYNHTRPFPRDIDEVTIAITPAAPQHRPLR